MLTLIRSTSGLVRIIGNGNAFVKNFFLHDENTPKMGDLVLIDIVKYKTAYYMLC